MKIRIPLARPEILEEDREAVLQVLKTPQLSMGQKLEEFESAVCGYTRSNYAVAVNSGTSALHLCLKVLSLPPGAEVILPSFTFAAPLNAILQEGLHPVFADVDPTSLNCTSEYITRAITPNVKAILAVHTFGRPLAMEGLCEIARSRGIPVLEDACEALGAKSGARMAGTFGEAGALAFYPNKQITTGEGGIFLTSDPGFAIRARRLRSQGRDPSRGFLQQSEAGYSYRLSEMNCALGVSQLSRIEKIIERRQTIAELYDARLARLPEIIPPPPCSPHGRISWFAYVVQLALPLGAECRDWVCHAMLKRGIATGKYFAPLHLQPVLGNIPHQHLPNTELAANRVIALPFFNQITEAEVEEVCGTLAESLAQFLGRKT